MPTYQETPDSVNGMDTFGKENAAGTNYGTSISMWCVKLTGEWTEDAIAFLQFPDLPANAVSVQSAELRLWCNYNEGSVTMNVQRCDAIWSNLGLTWNNKPGGVGNALYTGAMIGSPGYYSLNTIEMLNMCKLNRGMRFYTYGTNSARWYTSNVGTVAYRPRLTIVYTAPGGNQIIWMMSKIQNFYNELKLGRIPPNELQRRYGELLPI